MVEKDIKGGVPKKGDIKSKSWVPSTSVNGDEVAVGWRKKILLLNKLDMCKKELGSYTGY